MSTVGMRWKKVLKISEFDDVENFNYLNKNSGLYLWIVGGENNQPRRVLYVGETSSTFLGRQSEHFKYLLGGSVHQSHFKISQGTSGTDSFHKSPGIMGVPEQLVAGFDGNGLGMVLESK